MQIVDAFRKAVSLHRMDRAIRPRARAALSMTPGSDLDPVLRAAGIVADDVDLPDGVGLGPLPEMLGCQPTGRVRMLRRRNALDTRQRLADAFTICLLASRRDLRLCRAAFDTGLRPIPEDLACAAIATLTETPTCNTPCMSLDLTGADARRILAMALDLILNPAALRQALADEPTAEPATLARRFGVASTVMRHRIASLAARPV